MDKLKKNNFKAAADKSVDATDTKTVVADAPSERYQTKQSVETTSDAKKAETPDTSFLPKTQNANGSVLKQEVASSVVTGKGFGAAASDVTSANEFGLKTLGYSGNSGTISGSAAGTPIAGKSYQGASRVDKKLSDPNKDINFLANEQVISEAKQIPSLAENPSANVGQNGTPKNTSVKLQKLNGASSAELTFERSLDYIVNDEIVFSSGQTLKESGVNYADYPVGYVDTTLAKPKYVKYAQKDAPVRGNFSPAELYVTFKKTDDGVFVSSFSVRDDDISNNTVSAEEMNRCVNHEKMFINSTELVRQKIDQTCGSPTSEHFNPLGRSVQEPSATLAYLRDIEATDGAEIYTALRMANKAKSFYLSRTAKDGQDILTPAYDALYGHLMDIVSSRDLKDTFENVRDSSKGAFTYYDGIKAGSAVLLMNMFDSPTKYNTKADVVTSAKGLKMHLATGMNAMAPFRVNKNFVKALDAVDVYSTIDHGYDPLAPICVTDGVRLVHPYSLASRFSFTRANYGADRVYGSKLYAYSYAAGMGINQYTIRVTEPLLAGIAYFFEQHATKIYDVLGKDDANKNERTLTIPMTHYGMHFGLWDYLICAALPYIIYERTNAMKDILDYQENYGYPFDLITVADANPLSAKNYGGLGTFTPLTVGQMTPSTAQRWVMPEVMYNMENGLTMLPWYFSSADFDLKDSALTFNGNHTFTTPVIRSGIKLATLDKFFDDDLESVLLNTDRMVVNPFAQGTSTYASIAGRVYKYCQDGDGLVALESSAIAKTTVAQYYKTPRMLGWNIPALYGSVGTYSTTYTVGAIKHAMYWTGNYAADLGPSFRAYMYKSVTKGLITAAPATLATASVNVDRAQNFTQEWFAYDVHKQHVMFDLPLSLNEMFDDDGNLDENCQFTPFIKTDLKYITTDTSNVDTKSDLVSLHKVCWPVLQKLPFLINPFEWNGKTVMDPFTIAYTFGLSGFIAADYEELDYNHVIAIQSQAYGYVSDSFEEKSRLLQA